MMPAQPTAYTLPHSWAEYWEPTTPGKPKAEDQANCLMTLGKSVTAKEYLATEIMVHDPLSSLLE